MKVEKSPEYTLLQRRQLEAASRQNTASATNSQSEEVALTQPVRVGQTVLYVSLSKTLSFAETSFRNSDKTSASTSDEDTVEPSEDNPLGFDYKKVAKNVLGFVTGYIRKAQAEGADEDKLNSLLEQARKGIDSGFGQARDELKGMGLFSEDLDKGITKSYDRIQDGLQEFEDELFGKGDETLDDTNAVAQTTTPADGKAQTGGVSSLLDVALGNRNQASVDLVTKDGDKVTIRFDDKESWRYQQSTGVQRKALAAYGSTERSTGSEAGNFSQRLGGSQNSSSFYYSHTSSFSFAVEGELNQDELGAIGSIVEQMGSLADRFFSGDIEGALEQAKSFNLDDRQVTSLALNLHQQQTLTAGVGEQHKTASNTASDNADAVQSSSESETADSGMAGSDLSTLVGPFADYLQHLQQMIEQANTLFDREAQSALGVWMLNQRDESVEQGQSFLDFNDQLQEMMRQLTTA